MKICVLLPDYSTSTVDYRHYDPPRILNQLMPNDEIATVFLHKLTVYKQLKKLSKEGFDIFVNLCEGYLEWDVPSIEVIYYLELLQLPFTGPTTLLYDPTKTLMKYVSFCAGVATPKFCLIQSLSETTKAIKSLQFPLFVKPAKAGDSLGIDEFSLVQNEIQLQKKVAAIIDEYNEILVEEYIAGREFTVLVAANADGKTCTTFKPVEFIFPETNTFKTYSLKTSDLHTDANVPVNDVELDNTLRTAAASIFTAFNGEGYARLDFRMNAEGKLFFLEINFTCSVFYTDGFEGSADYILYNDGIGQAGFLQHIIIEGIARHKRKQKKYAVEGNAIEGYGIYATQPILKGEVVFKGEEKAQRIVTKKYVSASWNEREQLDFARYAYPISKEVYILWSENPAEWAPQNHSCSANTAYTGLNVVALRNINSNEELTLDYSNFLDETAQSFECQCGSTQCRGKISGVKNTSIT